MSTRGTVRIFILIFLSLLPGNPFLSAQTGPSLLDVEVEIGFHGVFCPGTWVPLNITVRNHGRNFRGYAALSVPNGEVLRGTGGSIVYRKDFEFPSSSVKRYTFSFYADRISNPLILSFYREGQSKPVLKRTIDLRSYTPADEIILVLSKSFSPPSFSPDSVDRNRKRRIQVDYPFPELLPDRWEAYDGVSTLVVDNTGLGALTGKQVRALSVWLYAGGTLILSGGLHAAGVNAFSAFRQFLPGTISGYRLVRKFTALEQYGYLPEITAPVPVTAFSSIAGEATLKENGVPLVIKRQFGKGTAWFLCFYINNPAFQNWRGRGAFFSTLGHHFKGGIYSAAAVPADPLEDGFLRSVLDFPFFRFPGIWFPLLLLLPFFAAAVLLLRFPIKRAAKKAKGYLAVTGILVLFSILWTCGLYFFIRIRVTPADLFSVSLKRIEVRGSGSVKRGDWSVNYRTYISASADKRDCSNVYPDPGTIVLPMNQAVILAYLDTPLKVRVPGSGVLRIQQIRTAAAEPSPVECSVSLSGGQLTVRISNTGADDLYRAGVIFRGKYIPVGTVRQGETREAQLSIGFSRNTGGKDFSAIEGWFPLTPAGILERKAAEHWIFNAPAEDNEIVFAAFTENPGSGKSGCSAALIRCVLTVRGL